MKRRDFVRGTGMTLAAGFAGPAIRVVAQSEGGKAIPASEKIVVGAIGVGGRGMQVVNDFLENADVEIAAVCDVDSDHLGRAIQRIGRQRDREPEGYSDFRKLLERTDLDAVIVGTPDHWHALPTIYACEAGKDVYVEKPLSHNWLEGKKMVEAAKQNNRVTQMGIQIHNDPSRNYARVAKTIQSGILGKIVKVRCWKADKEAGLGHPPDGSPPATLDYDFWLGPAPKRPYNPNRSHFHFRFFWDYAGGKLSDFGCHIQDIVFWSMGVGAAKSACAAGGKFALDDNTETPDTLEVVYEYDDFALVWSQTVASNLGFFGLGSIGAIFQGTDATLATGYTDHKIFSEANKGEELPKPEIELPPHVTHAREFLNAVKSRQQPSCNIEYGHALTTNIHLGNISYRTGEKVVWDAKKEKIVDNRRANDLLSRDYRRPWKL
jgi:predicted dehydrogenase